MCRMFMISGNFGNDATSIYSSLREVAERDPVLVGSNSSWSSHSDGWGMVSLERDSIVYRRELAPIYRSNIPDIPSSGIVLAHARAASPGEPHGAIHSHPYQHSDSRYTVFLTHNGSLKKDKLAMELGVDYMFDTDSNLFLKYIISMKGDIQERLQKSIDKAIDKEMFGKLTNIFVIAISNEDFQVDCLYYSYNPTKDEYGNLYEVYGDGWAGIFSSSIIEAAHFPAKTRNKLCETGIVLKMKCVP